MHILGSKAGVCQARLDRPRRKTDLELAPAQALLIHGESNFALAQQRGARVVPIPNAKNIHGDEGGLFLGLRFVKHVSNVPECPELRPQEGHRSDCLADLWSSAALHHLRLLYTDLDLRGPGIRIQLNELRWSCQRTPRGLVLSISILKHRHVGTWEYFLNPAGNNFV